MKNLILFFILIQSSFTLFAQEVSVKWGKDYRIPKKSYIQKIVGEDEKGFYILRNQGQTRLKDGEMFLERYSNDNVSLQNSNKISVPQINGENVKYEQLFYLNEKLLLFTSYYDKVTGTNTVFAQYLDEIGRGISELLPINEIKANQKKNTGSFKIALSKDNSKILVCSNEPFEKYTNEKISYKVLDIALNEIWSTELELPYTGRQLNISNHIVDNFGNVHMLAKVNMNTEKSEKGQADYFYTILSYFHSDDVVKEYEVSLKGKSVSDIAFQLSGTGELVAAGFYSNTIKGQSASNTNFGFSSVSVQEQKSLVAGSFYLKIDLQTQKVTARGIKEFERSFLSEFMSDRNIDRGKELFSYLIDYFILREDGGAILAGEQYYSTMVCNYDPRTGVRNCNYHYYYNDIVLVNINPDGSIAWTKKIPKKQHSINDNGFYSSYLMAYDNSTISIVFNDHPKNLVLLEGKKIKYMNNPKRAVVTLSTIDQAGNVKRSPLFSARDQKVIVKPKVYFQVNEKQAIIYGQKKKTYKMGKITFSNVQNASK
ncbi:MAG: hypothetical protein M3Q58_00375 [Bacteroidota bacterium]|nr:hypothetical protein [Bacteroidota bacterium]